ncbi:MAG: hypothetical protein AAGD25_36965 [Cyanobacteria bacterium P01_F01_bin.150]
MAQKGMTHSEQLAEQQRERERMQDMLLLVQQLVASQETTFKLLIDCLYDIGAVNFINQKVKSRSLGRLTKRVAHTSKPVFRVIAFYWVKRNCPTLITNWLCGQVTFDQRDLSQLDYPREVVGEAIAQYEAEQQALKTQAEQSTDPQSLKIEAAEVKRLQGQVKVLRNMLIGSILALGGTTAWIWYDMQPEWSRKRQSVESVTLEKCLEHSNQDSPSISTAMQAITLTSECEKPPPKVDTRRHLLVSPITSK